MIREYAWLDGLPIGEFTNAGAGTHSGQTQIDNTEAGASFTGNWTTGSGYIGTNYHEYEPLSGGAPPGGTTIDNGTANFKTLGVWPTATTPGDWAQSRIIPEAVVACPVHQGRTQWRGLHGSLTDQH